MGKKRKTKQEKIIADLRRKLQTQVSPATTEAAISTQLAPKTVSPPSTDVYSLADMKIPNSASPTTHNPKTLTYTYVLSDLKKTLLLTSIAIAVQVGLYFVLMK